MARLGRKLEAPATQSRFSLLRRDVRLDAGAGVKNAITMIERLFDEETQRERHDRAVEKRSWEKGRAEGLAEGLAEGRLATLKENAANMRANGIDDETIAKILRVDVVDVKIWLNSEEN